ncbi:MAG: DUF3592 domain-containing protein [Candidatus Omnitrophica bacterium]|nr:DUF3592 domain-containing protein [Candidatus Omnitrophota bacterium]
MNQSTQTIFFVMFFFGGFMPLILVNYFKNKKKKLSQWEKAQAVVCEISCEPLIESGSAYYPQYKYSYEGRQYSGTPSIGINPNKYKKGDVIEILFNPLNPAESDIAYCCKIGNFSFSTFDMGIVIFSLMSILCFTVSIVSLFIK